MSLADVGLASAVLLGGSGLLARTGGVVVQRFGGALGMVVAGTLAASGMALIAAAVAPPMIYAGMLVLGAANAIGASAANSSIAAGVSPSRLGLALGIKQSAAPAAGLLCGVLISFGDAHFSWRWLFGAGVLGALLPAIYATFRIRGLRNSFAEPHLNERNSRGLWAMAIGAGSATAAGTGFAVFLIPTALESGVPLHAAGSVAILCSVVSVCARIVLGASADHLHVKSASTLILILISLGGVGFLILASGGSEGFFVGAFLAFAIGWSWTGLAQLVVVRQNTEYPALATGVLQTGFGLGSAAGPLAIGMLIEYFDLTTAWIVCALLSLFGTVLIFVGRYDLALRSPTHKLASARRPG